MRKQHIAYAKTKAQISFTVTAKPFCTFFIPPAKRSFRGVYCFQRIRVVSPVGRFARGSFRPESFRPGFMGGSFRPY